MAHSLHGLSWATLIQINPTNKFPPSAAAAAGRAGARAATTMATTAPMQLLIEDYKNIALVYNES